MPGAVLEDKSQVKRALFLSQAADRKGYSMGSPDSVSKDAVFKTSLLRHCTTAASALSSSISRIL